MGYREHSRLCWLELGGAEARSQDLGAGVPWRWQGSNSQSHHHCCRGLESGTELGFRQRHSLRVGLDIKQLSQMLTLHKSSS